MDLCKLRFNAGASTMFSSLNCLLFPFSISLKKFTAAAVRLWAASSLSTAEGGQLPERIYRVELQVLGGYCFPVLWGYCFPVARVLFSSGQVLQSTGFIHRIDPIDRGYLGLKREPGRNDIRTRSRAIGGGDGSNVMPLPQGRT